MNKYDYLPGNSGAEGLVECLQLMDQLQWPPEGDKLLIWDPVRLEAQSTAILKIHKTVLLKELGAREGLSVVVDLYTWYWKAVVEEYIQQVSNPPSEIIALLDSIPNRITKRNMRDRTGDEIVEDAVIFQTLSPQAREVFGDIIQNSRFAPQVTTWGNWSSAISMRTSGRGDTGGQLADLFPSAKDQELHLPTYLRLRVWWGWESAPFPCMAKIIHDHLAFLTSEGYLRAVKPREYCLSEDGKKRLARNVKGLGVIGDYLGSANLASMTMGMMMNLAEKIWMN